MSNFANPELDNYFRRIILSSNTSATPSVVFANDLTKGLYWDINGLHLTGLSATPSDDTEAASKAYVDAQAGGGGANTSLSNLAAVAINTDLTFASGTSHIQFGTGTILSDNNGLVISNAGGSPGEASLFGEAGLVLADTSSAQNYIEIANGGPINLFLGTVLNAQFDTSSIAGDTRFLLWDVDSGALQRVTVGVADSGGTGFKVLRIPN